MLLLQVVGFLLIQFALLLLLTETIGRLFRFSKGFSASFSNSVVLTNNGNIGIPVNDLAFRHDPLAMSIQIVVVVFEILVTFTFGLLKASAATKGLRGSIRHFFRLPVLHAILLGLLCNLMQIRVPDFLWVPAKQAARNSASLALEYNNEPEFAAQAVLVSTLLSTITLTFCISLASVFFP
ncbi:hypothetical protein [Brevibacillus choshinensis]|uniref:Transporter n=1 Tax=Brevibacillus choshinensis TaxID=54911 RepID=A0ABX7FN93_BRECH|nr:hypothetical protein [Brevibacillus choshinensis]QRG67139.1 hypothetical protein JNE38_27355 [Brevibacillus choshinensis]